MEKSDIFNKIYKLYKNQRLKKSKKIKIKL